MPDFTADQSAQRNAIVGAGMPSLEADAVVTAIKTLSVSTSGTSGTNTFAGIVVTGTGTVADLRAAAATFGTMAVSGTSTQAYGQFGNVVIAGTATAASAQATSAVFGGGTAATASALTVNTDSISVTGADNGFTTSGNRAFMDLAGTNARFGALTGGGGAVSLTLVCNNSNALFFDNPSSALFTGTSTHPTGIVTGTTALSSSATTGFLWIPAGAGAPTGAPTPPYTNGAALYFDYAGTALYVRAGTAGWARFGTS